MNKSELAKLAEIEEHHWWFVERRHLLRNWAKQISKDARVFDIGAGAGRQALLIKNEFGLDITALEFSDFGYWECQKLGLRSIQADATELPCESENTSAIIAMDVLEHIDLDSKALSEFYRILEKEGKIFITVPAFHFLWSSHDEAVSHFRRYSKKELRNRVESAGFKIDKIRYWNSLMFPMAVLQRVLFQKSSDLNVPTWLINTICLRVIRMERTSRLIGRLPGTSIIVEAHK
jgi:SAM-dependent methyltransferase